MIQMGAKKEKYVHTIFEFNLIWRDDCNIKPINV